MRTSKERLIPLWMMAAAKPRSFFVRHRRCLLMQLSVCLVAASLTGFGLIGVPTVRQYRYTRQFVSTICTVERSVLDNSSSVPCRHTESRHRGGMDHNSSFPCLTVRVGYEPRGGSTGDDAVTGAVLYMTYYSYLKCPSNKAVSASFQTYLRTSARQRYNVYVYNLCLNLFQCLTMALQG